MAKSAYEIGAEATLDDKELGSVGPTQILREFRSLNVKTSQVNGVVIGSKVRVDLNDLWEKFYKKWSEYYNQRQYVYNNENAEQLPGTLSDDLAEIRAYGKQLEKWVDALAKEGITVSGIKEEKEEGFSMTSKLLLVAGGGILLYVIAKEVGKGLSGSISKTLE